MKQVLTLTQTLSDTVLTKTLTFTPDGHYDLSVSATNDKQFLLQMDLDQMFYLDMYALHGLIKN